MQFFVQNHISMRERDQRDFFLKYEEQMKQRFHTPHEIGYIEFCYFCLVSLRFRIFFLRYSELKTQLNLLILSLTTKLLSVFKITHALNMVSDCSKFHWRHNQDKPNKLINVKAIINDVIRFAIQNRYVICIDIKMYLKKSKFSVNKEVNGNFHNWRSQETLFVSMNRINFTVKLIVFCVIVFILCE